MNWIKPEWPVAKTIHAAVTTRLGGTSLANYASLNVADHVGDKTNHVAANRSLMEQHLMLPAEPVWMQQVHGNRVIEADQAVGMEAADASYSHQAKTVCVVMTADCLPILLANTNASTIAAIHGGWRGLLAGIISNTIEQAFAATEVIAWLGPAIGPTCFEVGLEVQQAFVEKSLNYASAFTRINEQKYLANIYQLATIELTHKGVTKVFGGNFCTLTNNQQFYSYRRDGETGRMATLIWRD